MAKRMKTLKYGCILTRLLIDLLNKKLFIFGHTTGGHIDLMLWMKNYFSNMVIRHF